MLRPRNPTGSTRRGAASSEYIIVITGVAVAVLIAVMLLGQNIAWLGKRDTAALGGRSFDQPAHAPAPEPGGAVTGGGQGPAGGGEKPEAKPPAPAPLPPADPNNKGNVFENMGGGPEGEVVVVKGSSDSQPPKPPPGFWKKTGWFFLGAGKTIGEMGWDLAKTSGTGLYLATKEGGKLVWDGARLTYYVAKGEDTKGKKFNSVLLSPIVDLKDYGGEHYWEGIKEEGKEIGEAGLKKIVEGAPEVWNSIVQTAHDVQSDDEEEIKRGWEKIGGGAVKVALVVQTVRQVHKWIKHPGKVKPKGIGELEEPHATKPPAHNEPPKSKPPEAKPPEAKPPEAKPPEVKPPEVKLPASTPLTKEQFEGLPEFVKKKMTGKPLDPLALSDDARHAALKDMYRQIVEEPGGNKLRHIFSQNLEKGGHPHKFGRFFGRGDAVQITDLAEQKTVLRKLTQALGNAVQEGMLPKAGPFQIARVIDGQMVIIRGSVSAADGVIRLGTAFIP